MITFDTILGIETEKTSSESIQDITETSINKSKRSCNRKCILILVSIILISIIVTILMVSVYKRKIKINTTIITTTITTTVTLTRRRTTTTTKMEEDLAPLYNISITNTTKWRQNGITIYDQFVLDNTRSMYVHDDDTIYTIRASPSSVIEWKPNTKNGRVVAGGNKVGSKTNQLISPQAVIVDKKTDSIIICDTRNKQILRVDRQNTINEDVIISDIGCFDLAIDDKGYLYVSDIGKDDVKRWEIGVNHSSIIVAGGNGKGNHLRQFYSPVSIFIDTDYSLYVVDKFNHRVMKWMKDAKEGIVVAGGNGVGYSLTQLNTPLDVILDHLGNVYVTDSSNYRVMRWIKGATEGSIVVGGKGAGNRSYQFKYPINLSFDKYNNLYVYDQANRRIQMFYITSN